MTLNRTENILVSKYEKKRLGQYFSGRAISTLLSRLASSDSAERIIDPMCGSGDMILACNPSQFPSKRFVGVEIDKNVHLSSCKRFNGRKNVQLICGNVFQLKNIRQIVSPQYDLVITNPPYVRYQSMAENTSKIVDFLTASQIKENLLASLPLFKNLDQVDRTLFEHLIKGYSGLSDLAVPSWILCCLLTTMGGRIAMVVPQAWMSREYSTVIKYILQRWFQIEYIIEDGHSVWFEDAQVKTTLVVAKRVPRKESAFSWNGQELTYCTIFSKASNIDSIVGEAFPKSRNPEKDFLKEVISVQSNSNFYHSKRVRLGDLSKELQELTSAKWLKRVEPSISANRENAEVKTGSMLNDWLAGYKPKIYTLSDVGVTVSQGLRTGANSFFYLDIFKKTKGGIYAYPNKKYSKTPLFIPNGLYREVIRKQAELDQSFTLNEFSPKGIVLALQNAACLSDIKRFSKIQTQLEKAYSTIPRELEKYICEIERTNIGPENSPKYIPNLSAVKPNIKRYNPSKGAELPRFWYMLPQFSARHAPELFVPRVNGISPLARLNPDCKYLVDANFSTIWISEKNSIHNKFSVLALLNSTWCVTAMEEYGTVMGGGALKLEATQINKLPLPQLNVVQIRSLSALGKRLGGGKRTCEIIEEIDMIVLTALGITGNLKNKINQLKAIKSQLLNKRMLK